MLVDLEDSVPCCWNTGYGDMEHQETDTLCVFFKAGRIISLGKVDKVLHNGLYCAAELDVADSYRLCHGLKKNTQNTCCF